MKKIILVLLPFFLIAIIAFAQYDPKALTILDEMSNKFKTYSSFKASFTYTLKNETAKINEVAEGEIMVKGSKYRLKLPKQEIFNNGTTVWTYMKVANEVNISTYDPSDDEISPTKIYTMYKKGYKYTYTGDKVEGGKTYQMIELIPEDRKNRFFKVKLEINKADKTIKNWKIFEKNGNTYDYVVKSFTPNVTVEDASFNFDKTKYPNVEAIDLR
ncbi:MAG: outer membrane lipoprotein carrier protein LolA [Cytophagales bacterium]|nr:outer membrane lipoprotein carrier protein LolA [Cytophaga sp.]